MVLCYILAYLCGIHDVQVSQRVYQRVTHSSSSPKGNTLYEIHLKVL